MQDRRLEVQVRLLRVVLLLPCIKDLHLRNHLGGVLGLLRVLLLLVLLRLVRLVIRRRVVVVLVLTRVLHSNKLLYNR